MLLEGKKALVTGGAGGLGLAICRTLSRAGCHVLMLDLPTSKGDEKAGSINALDGSHMVEFVAGDLSNLDSTASQSQQILAQYGPLDILVNNAGIDTLGSIHETTLEEYLHTQRINADAAYVLCQSLSEGMRSKGAGCIVNMMSIIMSGGWEDRVPYAMSKGALLGLTRSLARELGKYNIRVNAVSPGAIPTAMEEKFWEDDRSALDAFILERQALKFRASPEDVADAVMFLVSPQSRFITGHELHVNGGWYMG